MYLLKEFLNKICKKRNEKKKNGFFKTNKLDCLDRIKIAIQ